MSCQSAPGGLHILWGQNRAGIELKVSRGPHEMHLAPFIGFFTGIFGCGRGHRGPMIPYCPRGP
ncbi:unnamed protein product, partial [Staurois parvus]